MLLSLNRQFEPVVIQIAKKTTSLKTMEIKIEAIKQDPYTAINTSWKKI